MTPRLPATLAILSTLAVAQTIPPDRLEFGVTSVKPTIKEGRPAYGTGQGRGYGKNATLKMLIALAWQVQQFQIAGGPAWVNSDTFDVEGKTEDQTAGFAQLRLMMRSLLEDRYRLKLHHEIRESPVYQLVVGKDGPKIKPSSGQSSDDPVGPPANPTDGPRHGGMLIGPGTLIGNAISLSQLAKVLGPEVERTVIDKTNLTGRFDVQLHWTPASPDFPAPSLEYPSSIFTAVAEQLGLKLESTRGPVEFLIIDHCEKPSPN